MRQIHLYRFHRLCRAEMDVCCFPAHGMQPFALVAFPQRGKLYARKIRAAIATRTVASFSQFLRSALGRTEEGFCVSSFCWPLPGPQIQTAPTHGQVGFERWLDEVAANPIAARTVPIKNPAIASASGPKKSKRKTRRNCARCGSSFLAKRSDAKYCSVKCRIRASRHPDSQTETDNIFAASGTRMNTGANQGRFGLILAEVLQGQPAL